MTSPGAAGKRAAAEACTELRPPPLTYPHKLLINVLCQVLAAQHSCASARCVANNAADDNTQHISLSRQPGRQNTTRAIQLIPGQHSQPS
jgi:hypothetical protein